MLSGCFVTILIAAAFFVIRWCICALPFAPWSTLVSFGHSTHCGHYCYVTLTDSVRNIIWTQKLLPCCSKGPTLRTGTSEFSNWRIIDLFTLIRLASTPMLLLSVEDHYLYLFLVESRNLRRFLTVKCLSLKGMLSLFVNCSLYVCIRDIVMQL